MFGNYKYSLSSKQQQQIQLFLRMIPQEVIRAVENVPIVGEGTFQLLHDLTYAESWTEKPEYETRPNTESSGKVPQPQLNALDL